MQHARQRGLRQHNQAGAAGGSETCVPIERGLEAPRHELEFLRDVALEQAHGQRLAQWLRPLNRAQSHACCAQKNQTGRWLKNRLYQGFSLHHALQPLCHKARSHQGQEGQAVYARHGGITGQWSVAVRVAGCDPGKAGEHPAAQPLGERDTGGQNQQRVGPASGVAGALRFGSVIAQARLQIAGQRRVASQNRSEQEHGERCNRGRHAADVVQADIDPRHAATKPAHAEDEAQQRGAASRRAMPKQEQQGE